MKIKFNDLDTELKYLTGQLSMKEFLLYFFKNYMAFAFTPILAILAAIFLYN